VFANQASLQFQPIRRPQVPAKVNRPKQATSTSSSAHKFSSSITSATPTATGTASSPDKQLPSIASSTPTQQPNVQRSKLEDWVGDEEDEYFYQDNRQKGGRNKKKKNKKGKQQQETRVWDWDDIYDPTLPNNYADYKGSEEQYREIRDWKARLYYHQLKEAKKAGKNGAAGYSDEEEPAGRPANSTYTVPIEEPKAHSHTDMFAPPASFNFAPPSFNDAPPRPPPLENDDDDYYPPSVPNRPADTSDAYEPPVSFAPAAVPDDPTGEDAYTHRMRMSGAAAAPPPQLPVPTFSTPAMPAISAPAPGSDKAAVDIAAKKAEAAAKIAAFKAKMEASRAKAGTAATASPTPPAPPPAPVMPHAQLAVPEPASMAPPPPPPPPAEEPGVTLSRAPVRYQLPPAPANMPTDEDVDVAMDTETASETDQHRSTRPGQQGFAERLLKKYGWEKGQGLGAQGEGITTAIVAKAEKRKKLADAEGGGWAQPRNMGRIVGGKKRKIENPSGEDDTATFGAMSEVVKLGGMCKGMDLDHEIQENGLYDEIGREIETQYGKVERLVIWRTEQGGNNDVFVKFTSQLSAMRCVNAMSGMEFAGNEVVARFFDAEMFERQEYA